MSSRETKEPLKTMDVLIDDVIGGVNYFTQVTFLLLLPSVLTSII